MENKANGKLKNNSLHSAYLHDFNRHIPRVWPILHVRTITNFHGTFLNNVATNLLVYPSVDKRVPQYTGKDDGETYEKVQFISCSVNACHNARM